MSDNHHDLIQKLVGDKEAIRTRVLPTPVISLLWLVAALLMTSAVMYWQQPFRENFVGQIIDTPLYLLEFIAGLLAIGCLTVSVFNSSIPGERTVFLPLGIISYIVWIGVILMGFVSPVLEPSMAGKREACYFEALAYSIPFAFLTGLLLRRRFVITPMKTAILAVFLVTTFPAFLMQHYCMHDAHHALTHHLLPMLASVIVLLVPLYLGLKRRA